MILFPAIDLKDGRCVRLKRGMMEDATVFNDNPAAQAAQFAALGFRFLHCVDLDGAFAGKPANVAAITAIRAAIDLPVQLGGGIRTMKAVEGWLTAGITRVILGTAALSDPAFVREACRAFPGHIVVGADAKDGKIATEGWAKVSQMTPVELGRAFEDAGAAAILFTDVDGDGLKGGINLAATVALARAVRVPVIASGGVGSIADIEALIAAGEPNIEGVVIGRALYDGALDARAALRLANGVL